MRTAIIASALAAASIATLAPSALADTSYLRPNWFTTATAGIVTAQSSFTEDFANPSVAVRSDVWTVLGPDGQPAKFGRVEALSQVTILEAATAEQGTYRLSTGERLGRSGPQVLENGVWVPFAPDREIPPGAQTRMSQTATIADVYVTRGAPTTAPVDARLGRLEIKTSAHPNDIYLDKPLTVRVVLDGKPVADQQVELWREGGAYDDPAFRKQANTGADGAVTFSFDRAGVYLVWTRMSAESPPGASTPIRSYTTSLTFEVAP